jgi:hypothetical protein
MCRIARNAVIDRRRHASVHPALAAFADDPANEPGALDESIEQTALRRQLAAALTRLTPEHREVVRLAHYQGMTMREIAEAKGLPVGTIKSRAWHALGSRLAPRRDRGGGGATSAEPPADARAGIAAARDQRRTPAASIRAASVAGAARRTRPRRVRGSQAHGGRTAIEQAVASRDSGALPNSPTGRTRQHFSAIL